MKHKGQHVVPSGDGWAVRKSGASRASNVFLTQDDAIRRGRELAKVQGGELYIHGRDGRIRERDTFAKSPLPSKG